MAIVWPMAPGVEQYAAAGRSIDVPRLGCPGCKEPMSYWGWYQRDLRVGQSGPLLVCRQRCKACSATHAVLPSFVAHGRLDATGVIGSALQAMVAAPARGRVPPGPSACLMRRCGTGGDVLWPGPRYSLSALPAPA